MGADALIGVIARFIHPSIHIRNKFPNAITSFRLNDLKVIREETKVVNNKQQECYIFVHPDMVDDDGNKVELYATKRYCKIISEGPPEKFFGTDELVLDEEGSREEDEDVDRSMPEMVPAILGRGNILHEDVSTLRGEVEIDDDNDPAPENVPVLQEANSAPSVFDDDFGSTGICNRRMTGVMNVDATLKNSGNMVLNRYQLFQIFFPMDFVCNVIIEETNKSLNKPISFGEFLVWIGLWIMMSTIQGFQRRSYWSTDTIDPFVNAPFRFNKIMSRTRFEDILQNIKYTSRDPPDYKDPFWEVREMIDAWNRNMENQFIPSWISCLDESMSKWVNAFTCPGFMFVPRKPWPFGNEFHTIACCSSGILYALELVEGKDRPRERPNEEFSYLGKTVGLLLRLTKQLWGAGKVVILDSGFCVLQGIAELKKKGVFASALIKKRRYWPKYVKGDDIKAYFNNKPIGSAESLHGSLDGIPLDIFCMKEEDYVMMLMSSYGTNERVGDNKYRTKTSDGERVTFKYPEVVHNHYKYRDAVDSHNSRRMAPIAIEETWTTNRWPNRIFAYLLATSEVNANLGEVKFGDKREPMPILEFRRLLAKDLMSNPWIKQTEEQERRQNSRRIAETLEHKLIKIPRGKKIFRGRLQNSKSEYPFNYCKCRAHRVRTYCQCSEAVMYCPQCFATHLFDVQ